MRDAILNFVKQFEYEPRLENAEHFRPGKKFIVCGMGGSALAAEIIKDLKPDLDILIHRDYDLPSPHLSSPTRGEELKEGVLVIASSYSGNTEETISAFEQARSRNLPLVAISIGGKLLDLARHYSIPYIQMPDTGIQPRLALGFSFRAMLKAMGEDDLLAESTKLAAALKPADLEGEGRAWAAKLKGYAPVIYSSAKNSSVAYNWKIKFNETGKIPAFYNVFPELNHNEMTGFDVKDSSRVLSEKFYFLLLRDDADNPQIQKRMTVLEKLYRARDLPTEVVEMSGQTRLEKIFNSLLLADWIAFHTAEGYGLESQAVPMVEEFKKLIS